MTVYHATTYVHQNIGGQNNLDVRKDFQHPSRVIGYRYYFFFAHNDVINKDKIAA